LINRKIFAAE